MTTATSLRCVHCGEAVTPSHHGPVGLHREITCHQSPNRVHAVPDDVCGFDTDGDGGCAMTNCPACSGSNVAKVLAAREVKASLETTDAEIQARVDSLRSGLVDASLDDEAYDAILEPIMLHPVMATQSAESREGLASAIVASLCECGIDFARMPT